ncbi:hypothetical protein Tco_0622677 [Tanacetum coccineum]
MIRGKAYSVFVKEFSDWNPDIKDLDTISSKNSEKDLSAKCEDDASDNGIPKFEEGKIPKDHVNEEDYVKDTQWAEGAKIENTDKKQEAFSPVFQHPHMANHEDPNENPNSLSKPPGFEEFNNNNNNSFTRKRHSSPNQHSHYSSAPVKNSCNSKSQSKPLSNHGSMIEAFVTHIEMGKKGLQLVDLVAWFLYGIQKFLLKYVLAHRLLVISLKRLHISIEDIAGYTETDGDHILSIMTEDLMNRSTYKSSLRRNDESGITFKGVEQLRYGICLYYDVGEGCGEGCSALDIPLGGHLFTRLNKKGNKLSKLDRFLISESLAPVLQGISGYVLDCHISDHRPILLSPSSVDFGPTPFKFYNSWLLDKNLHTIINEFWNTHLEKRRSSSQLKEFDADISSRLTDPVVNDHRSMWIDKLRKIEVEEAYDYSQKAKIKWCIEADENSKFFHAMVNQNRRYLAVHGIKFEGNWIVDPNGIKDVFFKYFEQKFQKIEVINIVNRSPFYKTLSSDQNLFLDSSVTLSEIKEAIWDCGSDKSPGPDGFTFAFYKDFWKIMQSDIL